MSADGLGDDIAARRAADPRPALFARAPGAGSRWRALYRWAGEDSGWHDEDRVYEVDSVSRRAVYYHMVGVAGRSEGPHFTVSAEEWEAWTSEEGSEIGEGERLRMVPA